MSALHDSAASLVRSITGSLHSSLNSLTGMDSDYSMSESPEVEGSDLPLEDQLVRLANSEYQCFCRLKTLVEEANIERFVSDELILHFAQCSPGKPYDSKTAWDVIRGYDPHNWTLKAKDLLPQLETQTLFPVPGLKSTGDHAMFYMKPSRFVPTRDNEEALIENLVYVIKSMRENHTKNRTHGLGRSTFDWLCLLVLWITDSINPRLSHMFQVSYSIWTIGNQRIFRRPTGLNS